MLKQGCKQELGLLFSAANQRCDNTVVSVGSKACNESKDGKKDILLFVLQ